MKKIGTLLFFAAIYIATTAAVGVVMLSLVSKNEFGGFRSLVVQSGSMEPAIRTGDVIVIKKQSLYRTGEVITFIDTYERKVTHRVVETRESGTGSEFMTKGDANKSEDLAWGGGDKVLGKVVLVVPKLGYVINFFRSPAGFVMLAVIPSAFIIGDEVKKILRQLGVREVR